ncbi:MAG: hypothetical protein ABI647_15300, partial [Gemmatimonadota bacterium]
MLHGSARIAASGPGFRQPALDRRAGITGPARSYRIQCHLEDLSGADPVAALAESHCGDLDSERSRQPRAVGFGLDRGPGQLERLVELSGIGSGKQGRGGCSVRLEAEPGVVPDAAGELHLDR